MLLLFSIFLDQHDSAEVNNDVLVMINPFYQT